MEERWALGNELNNELFLDPRHKKEVSRKWKIGQTIKGEDKSKYGQNQKSKSTRDVTN